MQIHPVLLDCRPPYLAGEETSLLLLPVGRGRLVDYVLEAVQQVTPTPPTVVTDYPLTDRHEVALLRACPVIERVLSGREFYTELGEYPASDALLLVDPRLLPRDLALAPVIGDIDEDPRWTRHLLAEPGSAIGTAESVEVDGQGRVRRIQRFYDSVTWPLSAGVAASLVPVAGLRLVGPIVVASLGVVRSRLATHGLPFRDIPTHGPVFDLHREEGFLDLSERIIVNIAQREKRIDGLMAGARCSVDPTARFLGPVLAQDDVTIERGVTVVGPTLLGSGAWLGQRAVVAQSVVCSGATVMAGSKVRHRVARAGAIGAPHTTIEDRPFRAAFPGPDSGPSWPIDEERTPPRLFLLLKTLIDRAAAGLALLLLSPLLALLALLIKLDSRGPILYADIREGRGGRRFRCWKFRSMCADANALQTRLRRQNEVDGPQFKMGRDPRVTRVGRWLRPTSLDELPQLYNVLVGDMSFVGPRPSPFRENQICVPWREARLSVRPGITGLWQVCRHDRSEGDFHQWIYYDLLYVRHMSLLLDHKILLATALTLGGRGSVPLAWMVRPERYHERRQRPREAPASRLKSLIGLS